MPIQYRFAKERPDYSDLASGRVFYSLPGHPAFPIRLADEIFQRCLSIRSSSQLFGPCAVYDPCCGTAYHLSVLAYLHWQSFREIIGSDIDPKAISVARKNLGLLDPNGMAQRIDEIARMLGEYGKESHHEALKSATHLQDGISAMSKEHPIKTRTFQANALDRQALHENLKGIDVGIVFADVPYGLHSQWHNPTPNTELKNPLWMMLDALVGVLSPTSIVAVAFDKQQKVLHERYQRIEQFQVGKRRVAILRPIGYL